MLVEAFDFRFQFVNFAVGDHDERIFLQAETVHARERSRGEDAFEMAVGTLEDELQIMNEICA